MTWGPLEWLLGGDHDYLPMDLPTIFVAKVGGAVTVADPYLPGTAVAARLEGMTPCGMDPAQVLPPEVADLFR